MSGTVIRHEIEAPNAFTQAELGWEAWLEPLPLDELTERHYEGLVDKGRARRRGTSVGLRAGDEPRPHLLVFPTV